MYIPRSFFSDIGDVEVIAHQGLLHMFHLVLPNRDLVAHAVSEDGLSWRAVAPALVTGAPGECDDDMIRTVSVTERGGTFYMLYTATSRAMAGREEMAALATSDDLYHWHKHSENPVARANAPFYIHELGRNNSIAFRDPKPFYEEGIYHCLVCARACNAPVYRAGCAAHLTSDDLVKWEPQPPLFAPGLFDELECPQLYKIGASYYLFASIIEERAQRYWISDKLHGPYRTPANSVLCPPGSHYAGRLCRFQGKDIFACWTSATQDGPSPYGLRYTPDSPIRYVPAILEVVQQADATLRLQSSENWRTYYEDALPNPFADLRLLAGSQDAAVSPNALACGSGYALVVGQDIQDDFTLEAHVSVGGIEAGIAFALNHHGLGYFLRFFPKRQMISLLCRSDNTRTNRSVYRTLQERHYMFAEDKPLALTLRKVCGEIEISLEHEVVFSTVSTAHTAGSIGLFADCGDIALKDAALYKMKAPFNI